METRAIPSTGEKLPVIGCGTYLGFDVSAGSAAYERLPDVLAALFDAGGTVLDSSPMYGRAESVVGQLLKDSPHRHRAFLATKVWTRGRAAGIAQMERSLELMGTDRIDLMQVHNLLDWRTHLDTLSGWKRDGRTRYVGVTHYTSSAFAELAAVMETAELDFVQLNYSLDDRSAELHLLKLAQDRGIAVLVNRPFGGGSLVRSLARETSARLRARDRMRKLVAASAHLHPHASRCHVHHPRHRQSRAHGGRRQSRRRHPPRRPRAHPQMVVIALAR